MIDNTRNAEQKVFQRKGKPQRMRRTNPGYFSPLAELPDTGRGLGKGPGNFRRHMHRRRKRMARKLGYNSCRVGAIMCQEKRNCRHRRRTR